MCVPAIGAVAGIAGAAVSAIGAKQQAEAQAQMDEYNAKVARMRGEASLKTHDLNAQRKSLEYQKLAGTQLAAAAKGGVDPTFGSAALTIFGETYEEGLREQNDMRQAGINEYYEGLNKQQAYNTSAQNNYKASKIAAAGSFLSGVAGAVGSLKGSGMGSSLMINA